MGWLPYQYPLIPTFHSSSDTREMATWTAGKQTVLSIHQARLEGLKGFLARQQRSGWQGPAGWSCVMGEKEKPKGESLSTQIEQAWLQRSIAPHGPLSWVGLQQEEDATVNFSLHHS